MGPNEIPGQRYTMTWSGSRREVKFLRQSGGSRLRCFTTGTGELHGATLAGETMGGALALLASIELTDNVRNVVAFNPYAHQLGVEAIPVPGAGHFSAIERPTEMVRIIRRGTRS
jgi:pimeloyl-ACP methyl ester carboxylesterase